MPSIGQQLADIQRRLPPMEPPQQREARRLIDLLLSDPDAALATNRLARLVASGHDQDSPEVVAVAGHVREHLERLRGGKAAR
jgi:hypothetical protein